MKDTTGIHTTCLAILSTLLVTPLANAQSTPAPPLRHFGERGELVLSSDGYVAIDVYADGAPTTYVTLDLAADYFITDRLSIGGMVVLDHTDRNGPGNSTVGVGARIGYNFVVSDRFSIWPRLRAVFRHYVADPVEQRAESVYDNRLGFQLYAPVLFHPVPHFFIGLGPYFGLGGETEVSFGLRYTLGGWLF